MNTDRAKEFKPYEGQYRYVDALRDRIDRYKGAFNEKIISDFNIDLHCDFTDTVEEWERPDLGAIPAGRRMYTPYKAFDLSYSKQLESYPASIFDFFRANHYNDETIFAGPTDILTCECAGIQDGESYQPFINWEL